MIYKRVPLGLSNRHIHLTREDVDTLFGEGYELTPKKPMVQPGQYAAEETVSIVGPKKTIDGVRVMGPLRPVTQLEISNADARAFGVATAPVRLSGDLEDTPGFEIVGPKGRVAKDKGMIVAQRHIHLSTEEGAAYHLTDGDVVAVRIEGGRELILTNVPVRVGDSHKCEMHIDIEEGNAAGAVNNQLATIIDKETQDSMTIAELLTVVDYRPMLGETGLLEEA